MPVMHWPEALEVILSIAPNVMISDGPASSQSRKAATARNRFICGTDRTHGNLRDRVSQPRMRAFELVSRLQMSTPTVRFRRQNNSDVRVRRPGGLHSAVEHPEIIPDREMNDCSRGFDLFARR
jgi:hypothetical protein